MKYYAMWFSNDSERTAKLILDTYRFPLSTSIESYSRLFPYTETLKMKRFYRGPLYDTWLQAFGSIQDEVREVK